MRVLLRNATLGFVGGVLLWGTADVTGELTTYYKLRDQALELAEQSEELKAQLGHPFAPGPWYDAKIGFLGGGSMAQCTFQLEGNRQITDVTIRGLRAKGFQNRALYNLLGPGKWAVIDATAMFPTAAGDVQPRSLLPESRFQRKKQQQEGGDGECTACTPGAQQEGAQQGSTQAEQNKDGSGSKRSSWLPRWWGRSKPASGESAGGSAAHKARGESDGGGAQTRTLS